MMKRNVLKIIMVTALSLIINGCIYRAGSTDIDTKFYKNSSHLTSNNIKYEEIGGISVVENGWFLGNCDIMASKSIVKLQSTAESRGADAVIDVRWLGESGTTSNNPKCQTGLGWLLFWPALLLPGTSDTIVTGTMIKYSK